MSTPPVAQDERFSEIVKKVTWGDHSDAQSEGFVHQMFRGELSRDEYAKLVTQHYLVYSALERAAVAMASDPVAGRFVRPELARVPSLEADLAALFGADWASVIEPIESTTRYVARIDEVCASSPHAFVAHHYTRYLGDLSGGQMIGKAVAKAFGFGDEAGASFYVFDDVADPNAFKNEYRTMLDELPWDAAGREAMVAEVAVAYRMNSDVLSELGDIVAAARG